MGQQQLLLLVLGIVIVGLAVVVGIQAFSENQISANADAMVNDAVRIASDVQAWALKPEQFGGNAGWTGAGTNVEWNDLGYQLGGGEADDTQYGNVNGVYDFDGECPGGGADEVVITATNGQTENLVCVTVTGTTPDHIDTDVTIGGADGGDDTTT